MVSPRSKTEPTAAPTASIPSYVTSVAIAPVLVKFPPRSPSTTDVPTNKGLLDWFNPLSADVEIVPSLRKLPPIFPTVTPTNPSLNDGELAVDRLSPAPLIDAEIILPDALVKLPPMFEMVTALAKRLPSGVGLSAVAADAEIAPVFVKSPVIVNDVPPSMKFSPTAFATAMDDPAGPPRKAFWVLAEADISPLFVKLFSDTSPNIAVAVAIAFGRAAGSVENEPELLTVPLFTKTSILVGISSAITDTPFSRGVATWDSLSTPLTGIVNGSAAAGDKAQTSAAVETVNI